MAVLEIIGAPLSNFVRAVRIAAHEKGIDHTLVPARPHTPEVTAIHPLGLIPVMRHGEVTLFESRAMVTYLDRAFPAPKLLPDDALAAARIDQWVSLCITAFDRSFVREYIIGYFFPGTADGKPDRARIDAALPKVTANLEVIDRALERQPYLVGESFTLADAFLAPMILYLKDLPETGAIIAGSPALSAYVARIARHPSVEATDPALS